MSSVERLLRNWILPKTIDSGCFGNNVRLVNFSIDNKVSNKGDQFASEVIFSQLNIETPNGTTTYDVVIKVQLQNEEFRKKVNSSMQFYNEVLMYEKILPILDQNNFIEQTFCKYYFGYVDPNDPTKDFIVLEDLRKKGYRLPTERVFLDYEHCAISMRQLGKFHALSYIRKSRNLEQLLSAAEMIKEKWTDEAILSCQSMIQLCAKRGIQPLIDNGESVGLLESLLDNYKDVVKMLKKLVEPNEPESVLCHGDFNRNNLLFQYDENQSVTGIKFIDLQTPQYSSPIIDLSFFICMNTSHELRQKHLIDLINIYKEAVISMFFNDTPTDIPELNFRRYGIYGFIIASFFLPVMMAEKLCVDEVLSDEPGKGSNVAHTRGGQKETQALSEIIKDFIHFGFLKMES